MTATESRELLDLAQEAGRLGLFEWQVQTGKVRLSPTFLSLYGLADFDGHYETWLKYVFREDVIRFVDQMDTAFAEQAAQSHCEFRIVRPTDGALLWMEARNLIFYDGEGRAVRVVGVNVDVTERKRAIAQLRAFTETLEDTVKERTREIEALNAGLEHRIAERTLALSRANDEIQRFAYIVSHDLRAPLINIMGFTSVLEVGTAILQKFVTAGAADADLADAARTTASDDLPEAVRFIRASTVKMEALINAILKMSREGRRELNPELVDLGKLVTAVTASVQHQVDEAGARFELPARFPQIVSDRVALEQIFGNLVDNAVKYLSSDRPGVIKVGVEESDRIQITVTDNGRGIAPQDHERIFELFRRAGPQDRPGEGIGLAHVRALVRRLGGDITVQSQLGEGAAFRVSLPKSLVLTNESYGLS